MGNIPSAKVSPRVVNGVLFWYAGDTFDLDLIFDIVDQDEETYNIRPRDTVKIIFENARNKKVAEYNFGNITDNKVTIHMDSTETQKYPTGEYTYEAQLHWENRTTIIEKAKVVVE